MPKKKEELEEVGTPEEPGVDCQNEELKQPISKIALEFGREDLNKLRDKVNEIIDRM